MHLCYFDVDVAGLCLFTTRTAVTDGLLQETWADPKTQHAFASSVKPALQALREAHAAHKKACEKAAVDCENIEKLQFQMESMECPLGESALPLSLRHTAAATGIEHPPTGVEFCLGKQCSMLLPVIAMRAGCSMCEALGKEQARDPDGAVKLAGVAGVNPDGVVPPQPDDY